MTPKDWTTYELGSLGNTFSGLQGVSKEDFGTGVPYIAYLNVFQNSKIRVEAMPLVNVENKGKQNRVRYGDIFFTISSETAEDIGMSSVLLDHVDEMYLNSFCFGFRLRDHECLSPEYARYLLRGMSFRKSMLALAQGATRYNLSKTQLLKIAVEVPPANEQRRIARILSEWDLAIELAEKLISAKQQRKAALLQQLLMGKLSFGATKPKYRTIAVGDILEKVSTGIEIEPMASYREIGIRSHGKGIFHKEPVLGSEIGEKRVFKVEPGCFTFNVVFAWEQAVAVTTADELGFICSHRFPMFRPKARIVEPKYLLAYFLSPKGTEMLELASPGGAGRNRTLGQSAFLKLKVPLPTVEFQQRFVSLVDTLDADISLLSRKLDALRRQKLGLMQQLLTGKVRVAVTESSAE